LIRTPPMAREGVHHQGDFIATNIVAIKLHNETAPGPFIRSYIGSNYFLFGKVSDLLCSPLFWSAYRCERHVRVLCFACDRHKLEREFHCQRTSGHLRRETHCGPRFTRFIGQPYELIGFPVCSPSSELLPGGSGISLMASAFLSGRCVRGAARTVCSPPRSQPGGAQGRPLRPLSRERGARHASRTGHLVSQNRTDRAHPGGAPGDGGRARSAQPQGERPFDVAPAVPRAMPISSALETSAARPRCEKYP
jgi:hypothetical protein